MEADNCVRFHCKNNTYSELQIAIFTRLRTGKQCILSVHNGVSWWSWFVMTSFQLGNFIKIVNVTRTLSPNIDRMEERQHHQAHNKAVYLQLQRTSFTDEHYAGNISHCVSRWRDWMLNGKMNMVCFHWYFQTQCIFALNFPILHN